MGTTNTLIGTHLWGPQDLKNMRTGTRLRGPQHTTNTLSGNHTWKLHTEDQRTIF